MRGRSLPLIPIRSITLLGQPLAGSNGFGDVRAAAHGEKRND